MTKSRLNLRNVAIFACLVAVTMIPGCDKDKDSGGDGNASRITAINVINSFSQIATVKAQSDLVYDVIAQTPYKDDGFILELPATVPDKDLYLLAEGAPSSIIISDKTAKCTSIDIVAFDNNDYNIGDFYLTNSDNSVYAMWMYVDKYVTIKGEYEESYGWNELIAKFDVRLSRGWNVIYEIGSYDNSTYIVTATTQRPSGVNLSWYFEGYYINTTPLQSAKFLPAEKIFFPKKASRK